jgi:hypothetical protein
VTGSLLDLYDFDWEGEFPARLGAMIQAGFPSLGKGGEVFRIDAQLDVRGEIPCTSACEVVTVGPYRVRVWNTLPVSVDVDFVEVRSPDLPGPRPVPFSALMDPLVCEIYGLPLQGTYTMDIYRHSSGPKRRIAVTFDTACGFG